MAGKCCCAPEIQRAKNEVIQSLNSLRVQQQFVPSSPNLIPTADEIARRVADYLNPTSSNFEQDVLIQLRAISNALLALKDAGGDRDLLLLIARNTNDIISQASSNNRSQLELLNSRSSSAQARELLLAVTDVRRTVIDQARQLAIGINFRFVALGAVVASIIPALLIQVRAITLLVASSTAKILAAIAAIKIPSSRGPDLSRVERGIDDLQRNQLKMVAVDIDVPTCVARPGGGAILQIVRTRSYTVGDNLNRSGAGIIEATIQQLGALRTEGMLKCAAAGASGSEVILQESTEDSPGQVFFAYPSTLTASHFEISITGIDPAYHRTYKLAGDDSEYGLGNWSLASPEGSASQSFTHLYVRNQRLEVPLGLTGAGVRVSPKPGVTFSVTAFGRLDS